ncbi:HAD family hydrolase [Aeromicrobium endophyticum]|uniref:HAD family phosphatase n=1 Tax=Aeromicrobium endophyticum TaxID=2292704 RepID=A0A371PDC6_9ACTN|nr:HAD family phosphatase [Aeromicrobium endophyticum]REK73518.1 HAD family phosphatase [Aeromicrobium endophyticum]
MTRRAVLFDFGGVLTSSVMDAFAGFGAAECGDRDLPLRLLGSDLESQRLLTEHEEGRLDDEGFEAGFAQRLRDHGCDVEPVGLIARMQSRLVRDDETVALVASLRADGVPVGLLSNSLGRDCYAGFDLAAMFDAVTISGQEGVRKPSRRLYEIGCERLGAAPSEVVMVDDLSQNIVAAARLGMGGVVHRRASDTARELAELLGLGRVAGSAAR